MVKLDLIDFRYYRFALFYLVLTTVFFVKTASAQIDPYGCNQYEMSICLSQGFIYTERIAFSTDVVNRHNLDLQLQNGAPFSAVQYCNEELSPMQDNLTLVPSSISEKQIEPRSQQAKCSRICVLAHDGPFSLLASGIVYDRRTALEWYPGPDRNTTWYEAKAWVTNLCVSGGQWRMPTIQELETLYIEGHGRRNMSALFTMSGWWIWAGDVIGSIASCYYFIDGERHADFCFYSGKFRGYAVRKRKHQ